MKTSLALCLALLVGASASAQVLRPEAVNGAVFGGIVGAVIGHNSGDLRHNAWRGAAYGAGAGLLLGAVIGDANDRVVAHRVPVAAYPRTYLYRGGRGYGYYGRPVYRYYGGSGCYDVSDDYYDGGFYGGDDTNYAGSGLLFGALAGAVIGHNSGDLRHNAWRGAALGATTGYLLGSIADHNARRRAAVLSQRTTVVATSDPVPDTTVASAPLAPAAPVASAAPLAPTSRMAEADSLFGR